MPKRFDPVVNVYPFTEDGYAEYEVEVNGRLVHRGVLTPHNSRQDMQDMLDINAAILRNC